MKASAVGVGVRPRSEQRSAEGQDLKSLHDDTLIEFKSIISVMLKKYYGNELGCVGGDVRTLTY